MICLKDADEMPDQGLHCLPRPVQILRIINAQLRYIADHRMREVIGDNLMGKNHKMVEIGERDGIVVGQIRVEKVGVHFKNLSWLFGVGR